MGSTAIALGLVRFELIRGEEMGAAATASAAASEDESWSTSILAPRGEELVQNIRLRGIGLMTSWRYQLYIKSSTIGSALSSIIGCINS